MAQLNSIGRAPQIGVLGLLLVCHGYANAQQDEAIQAVPNAAVAQSWQQVSPGAAAPTIARNEEGGTRLEWKGGLVYDTYTNDVYTNTPTPLSTLSSLRPSTFFKSSVNSDLRAVHKNSSVDYFQLGASHSDDRSVLSQGLYQVNNMQVGRTGEGYMLALGDIAPNFSSLSSSLGVRGLYGQRQFEKLTVHGFTGLVAESWEALDNSVASNGYQKEVNGLKVERSFGNALQVYLTTQTFSERTPEKTSFPLTADRATSHTDSAGFQYQEGAITVTGETAGSRFDDAGNADRQGQATILDASWRGDGVSLRGGYHDIAPQFTSLSSGAQAGILEAYAALDWTLASWVSLTTDLRNSKNSTLATLLTPSTFVQTDSATVRANINFGPDHPGWGLTLQQTDALSTDSASQSSQRGDVTSSLNYSASNWNSSVGFGQGTVTSMASPTYDSASENWTLAAGRTFTDAAPDQPEIWGAGLNFSANSQAQRLVVANTQTVTTNYTLTLTAQRARWGRLNLSMTEGETTQPSGAPALRVRGLQMDAVYPMAGQSSLKVYMRSNWRNIDDPILYVKEYVTGLQLNYSF
jgi:hypothetical protein